MNIEKMDALQNEWADIYIKSGKKGVLKLAPRTGKIATTIKIWNKLGIKGSILISFPDNTIQRSWEKDFLKWGLPEGIEVEFTNTASLSKFLGRKFTMYVIDECHELSQREERWAKDICRESEYVLGLSGTINKFSENILRSMGLRIFVSYSIEQAVKDGIISNYQITIHSIPLDRKIKTKNSKGRLVSEKDKWDNYTYVIEKMKKEGKPSELINITLSRRKAVLSNSIAKRDKTLDLLNKLKDKRLIVFTGLQRAAESLNIPFYHSNSSDKSFIEFLEQKINHLAMVNIGSIGQTYENMDATIISSFTHNDEKTEQTIARCLVMDYKEKIAQIHFITSTEVEEMDKLKKTLKNFDKSKINWVYL